MRRYQLSSDNDEDTLLVDGSDSSEDPGAKDDDRNILGKVRRHALSGGVEEVVPVASGGFGGSEDPGDSDDSSETGEKVRRQPLSREEVEDDPTISGPGGLNDDNIGWKKVRRQI